MRLGASLSWADCGVSDDRDQVLVNQLWLCLQEDEMADTYQYDQEVEDWADEVMLFC